MKKFGIIPNLISPGISYRECMEMTNGLELSPKKVEYLKYLSGRDASVKK